MWWVRNITAVVLIRLICLLALLVTPVLGQELKFRLQTADGKPARVTVQGKSLGMTGDVLSYDITGIPEPVFLDVVLSRENYVPTLHTIEVDTKSDIWEPAPLGVCRQVNSIRLRVNPGAALIKREVKDGQLRPAGKDSQVILEVGKMAPGQPFVPQPVVLILEQPGYQPLRVTLSEKIWLTDQFPPETEPAIELEPAYGLGAWWSRTGSKNVGLLVLGAVLVGLVGVLIRMRYHYLREVESAHHKLQTWVERLDTFVEGSRALATPVQMQNLGEQAMVQAKRLTRSDWEWVEFVDPDFAQGSDEKLSPDLNAVAEHLKDKADRPLHLAQVEGSNFSELSSVASSLMVQPLAYEGLYRGFVLVASKTPAAFSETDREALRVLCHQLSGTVERIRLHAETVEAYRKLAESEQQLVQAAKMAAVGQLAAGVAHELNTPLNAINLGIEMAKRNLEKSPTTAEKRLNLAMTAVERASEIISKLLYYSREGLMEQQEMELQALWDDAISLVNLQLATDEIKVDHKEPFNFDFVGNPTELSQVLTNLLLNARDAVLKSEGAPRVIEVGSKIDGDYLELSVTDHGAGVPEDIRDRIFDPFYTSKNLGEGTGLGLSVSQKIAERHEGELMLSSPAGPTTFTLRIPVAGAGEGDG